MEINNIEELLFAVKQHIFTSECPQIFIGKDKVARLYEVKCLGEAEEVFDLEAKMESGEIEEFKGWIIGDDKEKRYFVLPENNEYRN